MITFKSLIQRLAFAFVALFLMVSSGVAQNSVSSGAQNAWNYSGVYAAYPSTASVHQCVVATADGVYVGAYYSNAWYIEKYDNNGAFVMKFPKSFTRITGLAASVSGDTVYGFDGALGKGYAFSPLGAQKFTFGNGYGSAASGWFNGTNQDFLYNTIAVNSQGLIYATDYSNYRVQIFNADGSYKSSFGMYGSLPGQFSSNPGNVAVGPSDEVLVIDSGMSLQKFTANGDYISKAASNYYVWNWWYHTFAMSRDGQLMIGAWANEAWAVLVDINTMSSDFRQQDQWIDSSRAGTAYFYNALARDNGTGCKGAAFDPAGNLWVTGYNSANPSGYSLERFERRMRFDTYKPTLGVLQPTILSTVQQAGKQTVDISYRVDMGTLSGGTLSGGSMSLTGGTTASGALVGGTLSGGTVSSGAIGSGTVTTAVIGWLNGVKNWSHLVVPSVGGGSFAATGTYFWSDMYDPATRIDSRIPLQSNIYHSAVDSTGNVYVATDSCVRKISPSGNVTTLAGLAGYQGYIDDTGATARFNYPMGICVDSSGNVYVSEYYNHVIRKITSAGVVSTLAGYWNGYDHIDATGTTARFRTPNYLACDASGNVYVTEWDNGYIRKVTPSGVVTTVTNTGVNLRGIAVDAQGTLYVGDYYHHKILKVVPNGTSTAPVTTFAGSGAYSHLDGTGTAATFYYPSGVTIDPAGNLYVTEENGNSIRMITPQGVVTTVGQTMGFVYNVSVDNAGNFYAAETVNQLGYGRIVRKGAPSTATTAGIISPAGVVGSGVQTGTVNTVSWDVSKDLPGLSFANLSFEVLAKDGRPEIGAHFVTIPADAGSSDLKISNRPISEAQLSDLWVWLLANRDPRLAISGNSVVFTQAGLDYIANAPTIYDATTPDTTTVAATGGTGGLDGGWYYGDATNYWGSTTNRGRAFACKLLKYRPVTASEVTRANAGRFNLGASATHFSVVNLAP